MLVHQGAVLKAVPMSCLYGSICMLDVLLSLLTQSVQVATSASRLTAITQVLWTKKSSGIQCVLCWYVPFFYLAMLCRQAACEACPPWL